MTHYGFAKRKNRSGETLFTHPYFRRDRPDLISFVGVEVGSGGSPIAWHYEEGFSAEKSHFQPRNDSQRHLQYHNGNFRSACASYRLPKGEYGTGHQDQSTISRCFSNAHLQWQPVQRPYEEHTINQYRRQGGKFSSMCTAWCHPHSSNSHDSEQLRRTESRIRDLESKVASLAQENGHLKARLRTHRDLARGYAEAVAARFRGDSSTEHDPLAGHSTCSDSGSSVSGGDGCFHFGGGLCGQSDSGSDGENVRSGIESSPFKTLGNFSTSISTCSTTCVGDDARSEGSSAYGDESEAFKEHPANGLRKRKHEQPPPIPPHSINHHTSAKNGRQCERADGRLQLQTNLDLLVAAVETQAKKSLFGSSGGQNLILQAN